MFHIMKNFFGIIFTIVVCTGCFKITITSSNSSKNNTLKNKPSQEHKIDQKNTLSHGTQDKEAYQSVSENTIGATNCTHIIEHKDNQHLVRTQAFSEIKQKQQLGETEITSHAQTQPVNPIVYSSKQQYGNALSLYNKRKYNDAIKAFDAFIDKNPNSLLIPNALYWKGESFYAQYNYVDAILIFKSIVAKYPKSDKASDALLKIGMSYNELGDKENALMHYRVLFEDYPNSTAVSTAKRLGIQP